MPNNDIINYLTFEAEAENDARTRKMVFLEGNDGTFRSKSRNNSNMDFKTRYASFKSGAPLEIQKDRSGRLD